MSEVSLFSGYSQGENRTTNYCLLVLKLLYEENPKYLGETLTRLLGDAMTGQVGVTFRQQERKGAGIPDGEIVQEPLRIHIETKHSDWFTDEQLERHIEDLGQEAGQRVLVALSNFETDDPARFSRIQQACESRFGGTIRFRAVSFEEFLEALPRSQVPKNLADAISDFEAYLSEEDLLPQWKWRLDVVNCSGYAQEVREHRVYICPAAGGAYNHSRAMYFGLYAGKTVSAVAIVEAVVDVEDDGRAQLKWKNVDIPDIDLLERGRAHRRVLRPEYEGPLRVFLLGELHETSFAKTSSGGMQQSKRYFSVEEYGAKDVQGLANALKGQGWT